MMKKVLLMMAAFAAFASFGHAQFVSNGSFEASSYTGGTQYQSELDIAAGVSSFAPTYSVVSNSVTASPWTFGSGAGLLDGTTTDGNMAAWLNPANDSIAGAVVSQTISFAVGGTFTLDFDSFAQENGFERINRFNVSIVDSSGVAVLNNDFYENAGDELPTSRSLGFTAAAGNYTLSFTGLPRPQFLAASAGDVFIDNVRVSVVPEPGSVVLVGLAGIGLVLRRRR